MFERICVPPKEPKGIQFDLGLLAESLIFYHEVYLILNGSSLRGIIQQLGPDLFLELIVDGYIHVLYIDHVLVVQTENQGTPFEVYDVGFATMDRFNLETTARDAFIGASGKSGRGRRLANRFCQHIQLINYQNEITHKIARDMQDGVYLEEYIRRRLISSNINVIGLEHLKFRFSKIPDQGWKLHSNLNLRAARDAGMNTPEFESTAGILALYGTVVADMSLWAQLDSEAALTPRQADILSVRVDKLLERSSSSATRISSFQDFVFNDSRSVREVINQGGREFRDILPVIQKARRFRDWLSAQQPDSDLIKEYYKEVTADTWIDGLPGKFARWVLFNAPGIIFDLMGGGGLGTLGGVALNALDSFFLDKIVRGWKPNQFVEGTLKDFLR